MRIPRLYTLDSAAELVPTSKRSLQSLLLRYKADFQPALYRRYKGRIFRYVYDTDILVARAKLFSEVRYRPRKQAAQTSPTEATPTEQTPTG